MYPTRTVVFSGFGSTGFGSRVWLYGARAIAGARGCDCRSGEDGEGCSEDGEELHGDINDEVDDVG